MKGRKSLGNLATNVKSSADLVVLTSPALFSLANSNSGLKNKTYVYWFHRWSKNKPIDYFAWSDFMIQLIAQSYTIGVTTAGSTVPQCCLGSFSQGFLSDCIYCLCSMDSSDKTYKPAIRKLWKSTTDLFAFQFCRRHLNS